MNGTAIVQTPVARETPTRRPGRPTLQQLAGRGGDNGFQKRFLPEDGDKTVTVSAFNSGI